MLLLLLLLPLLRGAERVGGWRSQAWGGAPTNSRSPKESWGLDDRYQLQVQKSVAVQEGLCVFIPCAFSYPTSYWRVPNPVLGSWFRKEATNISRRQDVPVATNNPYREVKKETKGRFQLLGDPQNRSCSLVITDAQREDTAEYFFQVESRYSVRLSFVKDTLSLEVTGLTQKPDVYVPETLEPGRLVTLLCMFPGISEGCPAPIFFWSGTAVSPQGAGPRASLFSALTLTPRSQDHDTELTCWVKFSRNGMSTARTIRLNVTPGEPQSGREFVQAAFVGAGLAALLFFCPCLILLMVKPRRRKATKTAPGGLDAPSVLGTVMSGRCEESRPGGPPDCPPRAVATPTSGEEQELQYASLIFHWLKPQEPQGQEGARTTEYPEMKISQ